MHSFWNWKTPAALTAALLTTTVMTLQAQDWPMWGRTTARNMVSPEKNLPVTFKPGVVDFNTDQVQMDTTQGVKWVAKLGSQAYGNVTVSGGKVFIGTNNAAPRDPRFQGDYSAVYCFNEADGKFLWQLIVPKLGAGKVGDWEFLGICSSPEVEGQRVYVVTNRCEVVCLDVQGQANGNDGPFTDEGQYMTGFGDQTLEVTPTDADIIWRYDMASELGVFPHNITSSSVLVLGDKLFVTTSNGVDWSHKNMPNPMAPALICLDKNTGALLGEEGSNIGQRTMHSAWSSPAAGVVNGKTLVFYGAGDGFLYGFDPQPVKDADGYGILQEVFRYDCNRPELRFDEAGKPRRYATAKGPSEIIATPVFHDGKVYIGVGQDPEHGDGIGQFNCLDASGAGDISQTGQVWMAPIDRTISTAAIHDGLLYIADYTGHVYCFDAATGKEHWRHDTKAHIWASTVVADGKVYVGNEDGILTILAAGKDYQLLGEIEFGNSIYSSAVVANGVLYVATQSHLYAITGARP